MQQFRYEKPTTAAQASSLLAEVGEGAAVLAGGTDLLVHLRAGTRTPRVVVDVKGLPGIADVTFDPAGDLVIGAAVTMRRLYEDGRIREAFPGLAEGAEAVGSLQIRARATVGGNLCNASPCMDTAPPLMVLGGRVRAVGPEGEREIPVEDFFLKYRTTALKPGEIVTAVVVPKAAASLRSAFDKIKRVRGHDLALVNAAAAFDPAARVLRAAIGSCSPIPVLLPPLEVGGLDAAAAGERLADLAQDHILPIDDVRASAAYRREMASLLCRRLAARVLGEGRPA